MPKIKFPDFLNYLEFNSGHEAARLEPHLSGWNVLHAYLQSLDATARSVHILECLMFLEFERSDGPRAHIIERLHGKYDVIRRAVEFADMQKIVPTLVKRDRRR